MSIILRSDGGQRTLVPFFGESRLLDEIDALTRDMWDSWMPFTSGGNMVPQTDIYEDKGELVVKMELPGISNEDLDVTLESDRLTIKAEKKEEAVKDATHNTQERYYGQYFRSITLPYAVKTDEVSATMENGVLEIRLPKAVEVEAKKIEIKVQLPSGGHKAKKEK